MKISRNMLNKVWFFIFLACAFQSMAWADRIYAPDYLWNRGIAEKTDPIGIADTHLGIPYRDDGALDARGYFTTFADPERILDTPGLNCSGLGGFRVEVSFQ